MKIKSYIFFAVIISAASASLLSPSFSSQNVPESLRNVCNGKAFWSHAFKFYRQLYPFRPQNKFTNEVMSFSQLCQESKDAVNNLALFGLCFEGKEKEFFNRLIDTYRKVYDSRCSNIMWYQEYAKYAKCLMREPNGELMHNCTIKNAVMMDYIIKNIPKRDQIKIMWCYTPIYQECYSLGTQVPCGIDAAEFAVKTITGPQAELLLYLSPDKNGGICENYPQAAVAGMEAYAVYGEPQLPPYDTTSDFQHLMEMAKNTLEN